MVDKHIDMILQKSLDETSWVVGNVDTLTQHEMDKELHDLVVQVQELEQEMTLQQQKNKVLQMRACTTDLKRSLADERDKGRDITHH